MLNAYVATCVTPLFDPSDLPLATRRKIVLGTTIPPLFVAMVLLLSINLGFYFDGASCSSPLLFGAAVQVTSATWIIGLYIYARITQTASDTIFSMFTIVMLMDGSVAVLQFPPRNALIAVLADTFSLVAFMAAVTSGWRSQGQWPFLGSWLVLISIMNAAVCFDGDNKRSIFGCTSVDSVYIVASLLCTGIAFGLLVLVVVGDYFMRQAVAKTEHTSGVLKEVCEHLSQCDTLAASMLLRIDADRAGDMPGDMRNMLRHLVDRLQWYSRFINPTMAQELRVATMTAATASRTDDGHEDFSSPHENPLHLSSDEGDVPVSPLVPPEPQTPVSGPVRITTHTGALIFVSCPSGFEREPHMFAGIIATIERNGGAVLMVTFSEIAAAWVMNQSASSPLGNEEAAAVAQAEAATRSITSSWPMPDLRVAISFGNVWGGAFGAPGRQRIFFLGGRDLRRGLGLPSLAQVLGMRVIVTQSAAVLLDNRCMAVDLIRFADASRAEVVYTLLLGVSQREYGNREVRARSLILRGLLEKLVECDPSQLTNIAASLREAARGDSRLVSLVRRVDGAVSSGMTNALYRRQDPFVRIPLQLQSQMSPSGVGGMHSVEDDQSAAGDSMTSELAELVYSSTDLTGGAVGVAVRGGMRLKRSFVQGGVDTQTDSSNLVPHHHHHHHHNHHHHQAHMLHAGPMDDTQSSSSAHSVGSMLSHWQRTRYEHATESQGLFEMYTEPEEKGQDDIPLLIVDNAGREWRRSRKLLGQGAFSEVFSGIGVYGQPVALKLVDLTSRKVSAAAAEVVAEVETMKRLRHRNVVGYISHALMSPFLALIMEAVTGGSLRHLLQMFGKLPVAAVTRYIRDAVQGVQYLHENNVTHCDIKPHNLLLTGSGTCKVADFGSAVNRSILHGPAGGSCTDVEAHVAVNGTPLYMAPEACRGESANPRDIWSIGVTTLELLTGKLTWSDEALVMNSVRFVQRLGRDESLTLLVDDDLPPEAQDFVRVCLRRDPSQRPSATDLLCHPFLAGSL